MIRHKIVLIYIYTHKTFGVRATNFGVRRNTMMVLIADINTILVLIVDIESKIWC